ncbi:MAG TPA: farnesyl diphosphate synthase [Candidatus Nitrosotenuis sp.]|nr:farnesyl diphosphate synthase [Candidatus Nitrosotenuis sp.]
MSSAAAAGFDLAAYMRDRARQVDEALERFLPAQGPYLGNIGEVMRYGLFPGGKRFRPVLTLASCEALGGRSEVALPAACAFEMIHCFSLIHDDLPCMDNDDFRRGKPTAHRQYGEAAALLAGDGLSIWAFHVASRCPAPPADVLRVVRELAEAAGHPGMVGGQVLDMDAQARGVDGPGLLAVHRAKTGALIRGAVRCGAILGGAGEAQLEALTGYGERVGLVFQITDDILDAGSDPDPVSFPALFGMEESRRMAREATMEALDLLSGLGEPALPLRSLALYLLDRET